MDATPYTRKELEALPLGAIPDRGVYCKHCRAVIPCFADITAEEEERYRDSDMLHRMKFARDATGCPMLWARLWALHFDGHGMPPCPQCGEPLLSKLARQCFECGADWH